MAWWQDRLWISACTTDISAVWYAPALQVTLVGQPALLLHAPHGTTLLDLLVFLPRYDLWILNDVNRVTLPRLPAGSLDSPPQRIPTFRVPLLLWLDGMGAGHSNRWNDVFHGLVVSRCLCYRAHCAPDHFPLLASTWRLGANTRVLCSSALCAMVKPACLTSSTTLSPRFRTSVRKACLFGMLGGSR